MVIGGQVERLWDDQCPGELFLVCQSVSEVAAVAIRARNAAEDHAADLGLVTRVA